MTAAAQQLVESFDHVPDSEKRSVASEILHRFVQLDLPPLSDDDLVMNAEEIFLEFDRREVADRDSCRDATTQRRPS